MIACAHARRQGCGVLGRTGGSCAPRCISTTREPGVVGGRGVPHLCLSLLSRCSCFAVLLLGLWGTGVRWVLPVVAGWFEPSVCATRQCSSTFVLASLGFLLSFALLHLSQPRCLFEIGCAKIVLYSTNQLISVLIKWSPIAI